MSFSSSSIAVSNFSNVGRERCRSCCALIISFCRMSLLNEPSWRKYSFHKFFTGMKMLRS
ncbi:Uncharacterised protein [Vibrio cholerae]|nr:Uncharacterised protein [Vibrio cholerae]CSI84761.1 Uncharacterised protein [Vibrio cholerae]